MEKQSGTIQVKRSFPEMLKGGVICDVVNADQASIAEEAGAISRHGTRACARRYSCSRWCGSHE